MINQWSDMDNFSIGINNTSLQPKCPKKDDGSSW